MKKYFLLALFTSVITFVHSQTIELRRKVTDWYSQYGNTYPYGNRYARSWYGNCYGPSYSYRCNCCSYTPFVRTEFKASNEDTWQRLGFTGNELLPYFANYPDALAQLKKFKRKQILVVASSAATVAYILGYATVQFSRPFDTSHFDSKSGGPNFNFAPLFVPIGALTAFTIFCAATSHTHLQKGIALYNKHQSGETGSIKPTLSVGNAQLLGLRVGLKF